MVECLTAKANKISSTDRVDIKSTMILDTMDEFQCFCCNE